MTKKLSGNGGAFPPESTHSLGRENSSSSRDDAEMNIVEAGEGVVVEGEAVATIG